MTTIFSVDTSRRRWRPFSAPAYRHAFKALWSCCSSKRVHRLHTWTQEQWQRARSNSCMRKYGRLRANWTRTSLRPTWYSRRTGNVAAFCCRCSRGIDPTVWCPRHRLHRGSGFCIDRRFNERLAIIGTISVGPQAMFGQCRWKLRVPFGWRRHHPFATKRCRLRLAAYSGRDLKETIHILA
jgi:hypothetical protein